MTINYNWHISQIECERSVGDLSDVAATIHWRLDGNENGLVAGVYGSTTLSPPNSESFTPFDELTKEQVIEWISNVLGSTLDDYKNTIATQIENQKNPPIVTKTPPWMVIKPNSVMG